MTREHCVYGEALRLYDARERVLNLSWLQEGAEGEWENVAKLIARNQSWETIDLTGSDVEHNIAIVLDAMMDSNRIKDLYISSCGFSKSQLKTIFVLLSGCKSVKFLEMRDTPNLELGIIEEYYRGSRSLQIDIGSVNYTIVNDRKPYGQSIAPNKISGIGAKEE